MQVFLSLLPALLFAPSASLADSYLANARDLADFERRQASLEAMRRHNLYHPA